MPIEPDSRGARRPDYVHELEIAAAPQAVWRALSEARELERWFPPEARCDERVGGELVWDWTGMHEWKHVIEVFEPGRCLRTRYDSSVPDGQGGRLPLYVEFRLEGRGGSTLLRLVHSGFGTDARFDHEYDGIRGGWPVELGSLKLYLERHAGEQRRAAWSVAAVPQPVETTWRALWGPGAFNAPAVPDSGPGSDFRIELAGAGELRGVVLTHSVPYVLSARADNSGGALFHISMEGAQAPTRVWTWFATWGRGEEEIQRWQRALDALLVRHAGALQRAPQQAGS
jgi:uncharacterized protein YndB with AHSA1/START domain